jgi:hypothetical protein
MRLVTLTPVAALLLASAADAQNAGVFTPDAVATVTNRPLDLSLRPDGLVRAYPQSSAREDAVRPRTAVDHRFAPDGLVGQAGYLCGIGGIGPDSDALRGGPASAHGHSGTFLGASLGYAFR